MLAQELVNRFHDQTILVTGDTYVDREIYGEVSRLAPEAPVPVVKVKSKRFIPGGAANVAKNICLLGGKCILCGAFGDDEVSRQMLKELPGLAGYLTIAPVSGFRLPERFRIFAANQQLLQMLKKPESLVSDSRTPLTDVSLGSLSTHEFGAQALVIYDQGYGFAGEEWFRQITELANQSQMKIVVDANPEHVHWYGQATLYTFNADESIQAARSLGAVVDCVEDSGKVLAERLDSDVLVTQGGDGMSLFQGRSAPARIPATRIAIADRSGAGDSTTAVLALSLAAGASLHQAAELANKAAGLVVAKPGIAYVTPDELMNLFHQEISHLLMESVEVKQRLLKGQLPAIESVVKTIIHACRQGRTVYAFGNGGSAADANHFITELVGRFQIERKALPAVSFSANEILMTSIANDYGYENTFARQVDAFVKEGDLVVAFSTSGKSKNVVVALDLAKSKGASTIGFTGSAAGEFPRLCDICIRVPSDSTPRIQESHLAVVHIICELLERELAQAPHAL